MRGKIAGLWKALKRIITRRSFLIKTLCTTLIACLIPLTILAGYHVYRENAHVSSLIETQLQNTTVMASRQFDLYISDMINIAGKLALSRKFSEMSESSSLRIPRNTDTKNPKLSSDSEALNRSITLSRQR